MKDSVGDFIMTTLGKLDTSSAIMLLPVAICFYILFFVPSEDIESAFGIKQQPVQIVCPTCGDTLIIDKKFIETYGIHTANKANDNM